jgi:hypothetical protein
MRSGQAITMSLIRDFGIAIAELRPLTKDQCEQHDVATLAVADMACGGAGE